VPISAVRIDVDDFKKFNEPPFDHGVGDQTLKHIVNVIRQKIRTRDRVYRVGGDEFALLCPDMSAAEAEGMMFRVAKALKDKPVPVASRDDHPVPTITLSTGIAECLASAAIMRAFEAADQAAIDSKAAGKDRITVRQTPDEPA
jgi:diguanylate cyclase (GGDEF)-like protein